jgi:hypothetical protein
MTFLRLIAAGILVLQPGCGYQTDPNPTGFYALQRIGPQRLPAPAGAWQGAPLVLGDTFQLRRANHREPAEVIVHRTLVTMSPGFPTVRLELRHRGGIRAGWITWDSCPLDSFCVAAASLVAAPDSFRIVGDSLFERAGDERPPRVYARIPY